MLDANSTRVTRAAEEEGYVVALEEVQENHNILQILPIHCFYHDATRSVESFGLDARRSAPNVGSFRELIARRNNQYRDTYACMNASTRASITVADVFSVDGFKAMVKLSLDALPEITAVSDLKTKSMVHRNGRGGVDWMIRRYTASGCRHRSHSEDLFATKSSPRRTAPERP